jgi:hypothetical protein
LNAKIRKVIAKPWDFQFISINHICDWVFTKT